MDATMNLIDATCTGARMPRANMNAVLDFELPVPPLPEQRRIVAILDEAFEAIATAKANTEKNLQNARELFETELQGMFSRPDESWQLKPLSELGTITSSKRIFANEYVASGVPFFRTKEIKELANGNEISTELYISAARFEVIRQRFGSPKVGDLLLTAIGTIGEIYVVDSIGDFYFKDGNVLWLKDFKGLNPFYLKYALKSFVEGLNHLARGSAYSALPINKLNTHRLALPPDREQSRIVDHLDSIGEEVRQLAALCERRMVALDELKKSLLHQAFTGQLTAKSTDLQLEAIV
jgi:type I restriction enzyme S subunit